jgi:hypothetical protein
LLLFLTGKFCQQCNCRHIQWCITENPGEPSFGEPPLMEWFSVLFKWSRGVISKERSIPYSESRCKTIKSNLIAGRTSTEPGGLKEIEKISEGCSAWKIGSGRHISFTKGVGP